MKKLFFIACCSLGFFLASCNASGGKCNQDCCATKTESEKCDKGCQKECCNSQQGEEATATQQEEATATQQEEATTTQQGEETPGA